MARTGPRSPDYEYQKEYWKTYRTANRERIQAYHRDRYREHRDAVNRLKAFPCADCGVQYPSYVMQFDHRPGTGKRFTISQAVHGKLDRLLEEIAKCDVVCANCHMARTWARTHAVESEVEGG